MYAAVQRKLNNLTVQEPNLFEKRKEVLHKEYMVQLDKTITAYPSYKTEVSNDYTKQLSLLNGITKKINALQSDINGKVQLFERNVNSGDIDIQKLKRVEQNLQTYTSVDDLDATSKRMLSDSISQYNQQRLLFWIKIGFILLIILDSFHLNKRELLFTCISTIIISILYLMYSAYTSHG